MKDLLVRLLIVQWDLRHVDLLACGLLDQLQAIVDDGQRRQAQGSPS